MNATLAGLLQSCAESPHDSTSHLILADWVEDHGQPERAELIRVQCRLADWVPDWQERQALITRQDELIALHHKAWLGALGEISGPVEFVRGLVHLRLPASEFTSSNFGAAFLAQVESALVEHVSIQRGRSFKRLVLRPWVEWVPSLGLTGLGIKAETLAPFLEAPLLHRLVALDLSNNHLKGASLALHSAPLAGCLSRLNLRHNDMNPREMTQLLRLTWPCLRDLDLGCNQMLTALPGELRRRYLALRVPRGSATRRINSLGMEFVRVPAGSFRMGASAEERNPQPDEFPQHTVTLTRPFYLSRFAVTQCEYDHIMGESPSHFTGAWLPVDRVGPEEASRFCERLSQLPGEQTYRLPTEAEWEHACRAGTTTQFHFGDEPTLDRMNFQGRWEAYDQAVPHLETTAVVGSYPPNAFGLHEMHGNIWECCSDWYDSNAYTTSLRVDPIGPSEGTHQVRRGGCFEAIGSFCRAAKRHGAGPQRGGTRHHGFRIVLVPSSESN